MVRIFSLRVLRFWLTRLFICWGNILRWLRYLTHLDIDNINPLINKGEYRDTTGDDIITTENFDKKMKELLNKTNEDSNLSYNEILDKTHDNLNKTNEIKDVKDNDSDLITIIINGVSFIVSDKDILIPAIKIKDLNNLSIAINKLNKLLNK